MTTEMREWAWRAGMTGWAPHSLGYGGKPLETNVTASLVRRSGAPAVTITLECTLVMPRLDILPATQLSQRSPYLPYYHHGSNGLQTMSVLHRHAAGRTNSIVPSAAPGPSRD